MKGKGRVNCYNLAIRGSKKKTEAKTSIRPIPLSGSKYKKTKSIKDKTKVKVSSRGSIRIIDQDDLREISQLVSQTPMIKGRSAPKRMDSINLRQYIQKRDEAENDDTPIRQQSESESLKKSELNVSIGMYQDSRESGTVKDNLAADEERKRSGSMSDSNVKSSPYLSQEEIEDDEGEGNNQGSLPDSGNRLKRKISKFAIAVQDTNKNQEDKTKQLNGEEEEEAHRSHNEGLLGNLKKRMPEFKPIQHNAWKFFLHKTASIYRKEFLIAISLMSVQIMSGIAFTPLEARAFFCLKAFFLLTTLLCFSSKLLHASPEHKKRIVITIMFCDYLLDLSEIAGIERRPSSEE